MKKAFVLTYSTLIFLAIGMLAPGSTQAQTNTLTVKLTNIASDKGKIMLALFAQADGFPSDHTKAFKIKEVAAQKGDMTIAISPVPAGKYALAVYHDENADAKLNTNAFGMPKEKYAFSNNFRPTFSAPSFKDAAFQSNGATTLVLNVK